MIIKTIYKFLVQFLIIYLQKLILEKMCIRKHDYKRTKAITSAGNQENIKKKKNEMRLLSTSY